MNQRARHCGARWTTGSRPPRRAAFNAHWDMGECHDIAVLVIGDDVAAIAAEAAKLAGVARVLVVRCPGNATSAGRGAGARSWPQSPATTRTCSRPRPPSARTCCRAWRPCSTCLRSATSWPWNRQPASAARSTPAMPSLPWKQRCRAGGCHGAHRVIQRGRGDRQCRLRSSCDAAGPGRHPHALRRGVGPARRPSGPADRPTRGVRRPRAGQRGEIPADLPAGGCTGRSRRRVARRGGCRLRAQRPAGGPDRQDHRAGAVHRTGHLRRHPAHDRHQGRPHHRRDQQGSPTRRSSRWRILAWWPTCSRRCQRCWRRFRVARERSRPRRP